MTGNTSKKVVSLVLLGVGIISLIAALVIDFLELGFEFRGTMLIIGILGTLLGLFTFQKEKYHRNIVNFVFLFPLLFTFGVTVIIPLILGIGYSFTDWDGVMVGKFVGLDNYIQAFHQTTFLYSILLTALFVVINMILVNLVAFLLALLCSSKIKGVGFFRATYFLPNLIGGIVLGYIWQFAFSKALIGITSKIFGIRKTCG